MPYAFETLVGRTLFEVAAAVIALGLYFAVMFFAYVGMKYLWFRLVSRPYYCLNLLYDDEAKRWFPIITKHRKTSQPEDFEDAYWFDKYEDALTEAMQFTPPY